MITAEQIPDEVLKVLGKELPGYEHNTKTICYALAAALNAWPMAGIVATEDYTGRYPQIILPLPKEGE
jgi:hypothetical protein